MEEGVRKPAQRGKPRRFCTAVAPGECVFQSGTKSQNGRMISLPWLGADREGTVKDLLSIIHYLEAIFSPLASFPGPVCSGEQDAVSCQMFYSFS